ARRRVREIGLLGGVQRKILAPPNGQDQVGTHERAIGSANRVRACTRQTRKGRESCQRRSNAVSVNPPQGGHICVYRNPWWTGISASAARFTPRTAAATSSSPSLARH